MSISTTSGVSFCASSTASSPSLAWPTTVDPLVAGEDRLESLGEETVVVGDEHADRLA